MRHNWFATAALAVSTGLITAATVWAAPAHADLIDDSFLSALSGSGMNFGNLGNSSDTAVLGQSVCSMLTEPAGTFASTATSISGKSGMSPEMAQIFAEIAVKMYCPEMVSQLAHGELPQIPGLSGGSGLPGLSGLGGLGGIPGVGGIPGIPGIPGL